MSISKDTIQSILISNFYNAESGLVLLDLEMKILVANNSLTELFNRQSKALKTNSLFTHYFTEEQREILAQKFDICLKEKRAQHEVYIECLSEYWLLLFTYQQDKHTGSRVQIVFVNTTRSRQIERVFSKLTYMARFTKNLITLSDEQLRLTYANQAFLQTTEYDIDEIIGKDVGKILLGPKTDASIIRYKSDQIDQNLPYRIEILNYKKSGKMFWQDLEVVPIKDKDEVVIGYMSIARDITEEKEKEQTIKRLLDQLSGAEHAIPESLSSSLDQLTKRELEIFNLIKLGMSNTKIGQNLNISTRTAEKHRQNIFQKLEVSSTVDLLTKY